MRLEKSVIKTTMKPMNMISVLRQRVKADGKATISVAEYDQLQAEWITRAKVDAPAAPSLAPAWISVKDGLPTCDNEDTGRCVMISDTMHIFGVDVNDDEAVGFGDYCAEEGAWRNFGGNFDFMHVAKVTHYMPISRPKK